MFQLQLTFILTQKSKTFTIPFDIIVWRLFSASMLQRSIMDRQKRLFRKRHLAPMTFKFTTNIVVTTDRHFGAVEMFFQFIFRTHFRRRC